MASYTYEQLKVMTVAQLREIAQGLPHEGLEGYSTMHKDHLLPALCKALDIHIHHAAEGSEKVRLKTAIRQLKTQRTEAAGDASKQAVIRGKIHSLKRQLRRLVAKTA